MDFGSLYPLCCTVLCLVIQSYLTLCDHMDFSPAGFSVHGDSPGKNIGVGCHAYHWGIFPLYVTNFILLLPLPKEVNLVLREYSNTMMNIELLHCIVTAAMKIKDACSLEEKL